MKQMKHKRLECPFSNVEHFKSIGLIDEKWKFAFFLVSNQFVTTLETLLSILKSDVQKEPFSIFNFTFERGFEKN